MNTTKRSAILIIAQEETLQRFKETMKETLKRDVSEEEVQAYLCGFSAGVQSLKALIGNSVEKYLIEVLLTAVGDDEEKPS